MDEDLVEVMQRELTLLQPQHRAQPEEVLALLHPDFVEFGASGRRWDAAGIAASLATEDPSAPPAEAIDLTPARLADDVVLLTYTAHLHARVTLRCSVWMRDPGRGWLLRFHQGTVAPD